MAEEATAVAEAPAPDVPGVVEGAAPVSDGPASRPEAAAEPPAPSPVEPAPVRQAAPRRESPPPRRAADGRFEAAAEPAAAPAPDDPSASLLDWHDMIPPDLRKEPVWDKFKTPQDAFKSLVEQEKLLGRMVPLPREGASDAQMRAFYERLGCPKLAADYVVADPDMGTDADGQARTLAPDFLTSLLEVCHQAGLRNEQAQQFVNFAARTVVRSENLQAGEQAAARAQAQRDLYDAFGGDAPAMVEKARMFMLNMGTGRYGGGAYAERAAEKLKTSALANDIDVIAALANGWDNFREGIWVGDEIGGSLTSMEQIDAEIVALGRIMNDDAKPIEERQAAQKKQFALFQQRNDVQDAHARRQQTLRR